MRGPINIANQELMPVWTKPGKWSLGRDPLGIQATSVRMYRKLVPGLTNVTNRLRYYSYYCWVVALWARIRHVDNEKEWRLFIRRAEALYALACESVKSGTHGLAGSEWAGRYWAELNGKSKGTRIDLMPYTNRPGDKDQYLMAKRGNFGQFYVRSMLDVKLLGDSARIPIVAKAGQALAVAFTAAIGKDVARQLEKAVDSGKISIDILQKIGNAVHPSRLDSKTREMKLLRDFLWPKSFGIPSSDARRTSAWLLLDLTRKGVPVFDETVVRRIFYQRILPNGEHYSVEGKIIDSWRAFQANEMCHIALEALLNAMATVLVEQSEGMDPGKLVGDLVKVAIPAKERKMIWAEWAVTAFDGVPDAEDTLCQEVLDGLRQYKKRAKDPKVLQAAVKLLGVLWAKWSTGAKHVQDEIARSSSISLAGVFSTLKDASSSTAGEALATVVRRHIIAEHLAIAGRKLALSGKYTYRFVLEDGVLSNGWVAEYRYTNPRLGNLATFLVDAKLINAKGDVTATGTSLLNAYQPT